MLRFTVLFYKNIEIKRRFPIFLALIMFLISLALKTNSYILLENLYFETLPAMRSQHTLNFWLYLKSYFLQAWIPCKQYVGKK